MSSKNLGYEYKCDLCGVIIESIAYPEKYLTGCSFEARKSGFMFVQRIDICQKCWPTDGFFRDPLADKKLPTSLIKKCLDFMTKTNKDGEG